MSDDQPTEIIHVPKHLADRPPRPSIGVIFWIVIAVMILAAVVLLILSQLDAARSPAADRNRAASTQEADDSVDAPTDTGLTFVINAVYDHGAVDFDAGHIVLRAQGHFVVMDVTVTNTDVKPRTLLSDEQFIVDGFGRRHRPNGETRADAVFTGEGGWLKNVNPGNSLRTVLVFDVPRGTDVQRFEFHGEPGSDGVSVAR